MSTPSIDPNKKGSLVDRVLKRNKPLTYKDFNFEHYKELRQKMEQFRANAHGEGMDALWESIEKKYLPHAIDELRTMAEYEIDTNGVATPTRFFAESADDGLIEHQEPLVAIKVHTGLSLMTQRTPDILWDSDNELYESRVPVLNALRKEDWMDDQTRQQYAMLWFYNVLYGTTFWRRFYDKYERETQMVDSIDLSTNEQTYKKSSVVEIDQTVGEALSPLDVYIDPGTVPMKPRTMRYVSYDKVYDYDTFYRLFKDEAKAEYFDEVQPTSLPGYEGDHWVKCSYLEHQDLDLFYVVANDKPLLKKPLPWNHKGLSVRMATWLPRGRKNPFGLGPIEMMGPDSKLLSELASMTVNQVRFSIYKSIFYQGQLEVDGGESGDIRLRPDKAYKTTDPKSISFLDIPGPGADAWRAIDAQRSRVDEASGLNKTLGGELAKTTAFEIDVAKDAALARLATPIASVAQLLRWDAEVTFELQKQFYTLPQVTEIVDPDKIQAAVVELQKIKDLNAIDPKSPKATFDIWFDESDAENPRAFRGDYRTAQLSLQENAAGESLPSLGKQQTVISPEVYDWRGRLHVVTDSMLSITPTLERTRKLEAFNILIPMFVKPKEWMAKPARALAKLYGVQIEDVLPEDWLLYLKQVDEGTVPPQMPIQNPVGRPPNAEGGIEKAMQPGGFSQDRAEQVVTNVGGQNSLASAQTANVIPR